LVHFFRDALPNPPASRDFVLHNERQISAYLRFMQRAGMRTARRAAKKQDQYAMGRR
jgi:hypothetical protein